MLINKEPGTFLVRMSAHPDHACVISVVLGDAGRTGHPIGHCTRPVLGSCVAALTTALSDVIVQEPGKGFCLDVESQERIFFHTLPQLVDHYIKLGAKLRFCHLVKTTRLLTRPQGF